MTVLTTMILLSTVPAYTLEEPGIDFLFLPEYLAPLEEGVLSTESGALAGQPNSLGINFGCYYWRTDAEVTDRDLWIQEKLTSVIPPDFIGCMLLGDVNWVEGSMAAGVSPNRSLGLLTMVNFTFSPPGGVMGRGRAYGVFRNGYAVLLIAYGPSDSDSHLALEEIAGMAVLSE